MADQGEGDPEYRLSGSVIVGNEEGLRELLRRPLDFGCKPVVMRLPDGRFQVTVIGTEATLLDLAGPQLEVAVHRGQEGPTEVGQGDRFDGGRVAPRGLGRKEKAE